MSKKCIKCPFSNISSGTKKTKIMCIVPHCIREYDRKIRAIKERTR